MDLLFGDRSFKIGRKFHTFVGHENPDIDVTASFWLADNAGLGMPNHRYIYVPAGTALPGSERDPGVIHFDTGGGPFDQHGKSLARTCSTALLAEKLGLTRAPGLQEILEWVTIFDNDLAYFPPTHIHHVVAALPRQPSCKDGDGFTTDWDKVRLRTYELLDGFFRQEKGRQLAREEFPRLAKSVPLQNGLVVFTYPRRYFFSELAQEGGGDLGIQFHDQGDGRFYVGIKVFRGKQVNLTGVAVLLRHAEAQRRGYSDLRAENGDLDYLGNRPPLNGWFLHDSRRIVSCGSLKRGLQDSEYTQLTTEEIEMLVCTALEGL